MLIGIAVVIGIVLLQVVDGGGSGGGSIAPPIASGDDSTTSTSNASPPEAVSTFVLNGSGVANAASTKANELLGLGYVQAGTGNAPTQTGTTVHCKEGFEAEAEELATQLRVSIATVTVQPYPAAPAADAAAATCIIIIGK